MGVSRIRSALVAVTAVTAVVLGGCSAIEPGRAGRAEVRSGADTETSSEVATCTDVTYADPSIAFEPALADGAELAVGQTSWLTGATDTTGVVVSGDPGVIELNVRTAPTRIECGHASSTVSWVEVTAKRPGTAVLTVPGRRPLQLTVR